MPQALLSIFNKELKASLNNNSRSNNYYLVGIILCLLLFSAAILGVWMALSWIKDVNQLSFSKLVITGERRYTRDDNIREAILTLDTPSTFTAIDVNAIKNRIKALPWISQVTVRKRWPNELNIHLVEYKPYAKWNNTFYINTEGTIFSLPTLLNVNGSFLMLYGPQDSQKKVLKMYRTMQQQLAPHNFSIKSVSMTTRSAWQLVLTNDIQLNIGKQDIKKRLNRFIKLYPLLKQVTDKRIRYIDLRYSSGAAVGWLPHLVNAQH